MEIVSKQLKISFSKIAEILGNTVMFRIVKFGADKTIGDNRKLFSKHKKVQKYN